MLYEKEKQKSRAVVEHVWELQHCIAWNDMKILGQDTNNIPRKTRDTMYIIQCWSALINRDMGLEVSHVWDSLFSN